MRSEESVKKLRDLMAQRYEKGGTAVDEVMMPADAFECAHTLNWVLGENCMDELFDQAGLDSKDWN